MATNIPDIKAPELSDLEAIASRNHLNISDEDLTIYKDYIQKSFDAVYHEIEKYPDQCLPVKYYSPGARTPTVQENPYNAWTLITDTVGSGQGKLFGKMVAIKDNVSMAGVGLSNGSTFMHGYVPQYNATVVDRILDEGATIRGKSECEDLCFSGSSFSSATGPVLNPRDVTRVAGGSSSGSAVLVAAGEVDMAVGTDQGGSIRLPSCWCGVVGLKPTFGLVPYTGIVSLSRNNDHVGPIARTVKDCALLLEVIAGSDGLDGRQPTNIQSKQYSEKLDEGIKGLRIGILQEGFLNAEKDVTEVIMNAANNLTNIGAIVHEFSTDVHRKAKVVGIAMIKEGTFSTIMNCGIHQTMDHQDVQLQDFLHQVSSRRLDQLPVGVKSLFMEDSYIKEKYGNHFYAKSVNWLRNVINEYDELFKQYDAIVMPTIKYKAPKLPQGKLGVKEFLDEHLRMIDNTTPYNATGHPAITVNVGCSEGLPIGMMVVGPHWKDELVLRVAYAVEQQTIASMKS